MTNPTSELVARLNGLRANVTPELFTAKPHRIAQMLRDGAHCQRPKADNIDRCDFESDAVFILEAVNALPALLAALTKQEELVREAVRVMEHYLNGSLSMPRFAEEEARAFIASAQQGEG